MAICINQQGICFGSFSITPSADGICIIDKFPFASDSFTASDVGDLTAGSYLGAGASSSTHGYTAGGFPAQSRIDKFSFTSDSNAVDGGELPGVRYYNSGASSTTHGYSVGGDGGAEAILKFPFTSDTTSTDVGETFNSTTCGAASASSITHGYAAGGSPTPSQGTTIQKFPFSSDTSASDVGELIQGAMSSAGQNSATHGYRSGGPSSTGPIEKYPFAADTPSSDVGELIISSGSDRNVGTLAGGSSSTACGYVLGREIPAVNACVQRFSFAADVDAIGVGSLSVARRGVSGHQV